MWFEAASPPPSNPFWRLCFALDWPQLLWNTHEVKLASSNSNLKPLACKRVALFNALNQCILMVSKRLSFLYVWAHVHPVANSTTFMPFWSVGGIKPVLALHRIVLASTVVLRFLAGLGLFCPYFFLPSFMPSRFLWGLTLAKVLNLDGCKIPYAWVMGGHLCIYSLHPQLRVHVWLSNFFKDT